MKEENLRKLAAQKLLQLNECVKGHEKRAHAIRLIYKQAEMGYGAIPTSYNELEEKIASMLNQDLEVVEKALELSGGNMKLGEIDSVDISAPRNANEAFEASILNN